MVPKKRGSSPRVPLLRHEPPDVKCRRSQVSDPPGLTPWLQLKARNGVSHSPAAPTLDDETERATRFPPPLWGRDRVGGNPRHRISGFPPPLAPPHKGEGKPRSGLQVPNSAASVGSVSRQTRSVRHRRADQALGVLAV